MNCELNSNNNSNNNNKVNENNNDNVINNTLHSTVEGMDVHDCGSVNKGQPLLPGNVITVEPGIYIPSSNTRKLQ